ncbi:MAG TPA: MarR family transcriptional regulator [Nocardioidaceae bacterium]|nr:MarR family transcriptional regulator [Nocardioidaceae bacterium]
MADGEPVNGNSRDDVVWLAHAQQDAWRAFLVGSTLLMDRLDRDLREEHGISLVEYEILVRLSEAPRRRLRMAGLAHALCHSRSRVTHTISRMEKVGLVERDQCQDDGRGIEAVLTDRGYTTLVAAAPTHVSGVRECLVDVAEADDLAGVGRVFGAVADNLASVENAELRSIRP